MKSKGKQNEEAKETIPNMSCRTEYALKDVQKWNNNNHENISEHVMCHFYFIFLHDNMDEVKISSYKDNGCVNSDLKTSELRNPLLFLRKE